MAEINRYSNSKIYKICSNLTDKIYIGSTTQSISQRLSEHIRNYKYYLKNNTNYITSIEIIKLGDAFIVLLEQCNYNNKQQLERREGEIIKLNINNVVNMVVAGIKDKEHIAEIQKNYRLENKEHLKTIKNNWYIDNKEIIAEQRKETFTCKCGSILRFSDKSQHNKTKKHINFSYLNELTFYNL